MGVYVAAIEKVVSLVVRMLDGSSTGARTSTGRGPRRRGVDPKPHDGETPSSTRV